MHHYFKRIHIFAERGVISRHAQLNMKASKLTLKQLRSDLGIDAPFIKGEDKPVRRCWHFCTDGKSIDFIFTSDEDFRCGMNRIYFVVRRYKVVIIAFVLMGTHIHFILWGEYDECLAFVREYLRRTSLYIKNSHGEKRKLEDIPISCQSITDDFYLKTVICYVIKNPPVGGLPYNAYDYPWSSGALYFRRSEYWTTPEWINKNLMITPEIGTEEQRKLFHTKEKLPKGVKVFNGNLIFPGEYVVYEIVEELFHTCRSFNYFMCQNKEIDIESRQGIISGLSMPLQELRQHRDELCREIFNVYNQRSLDMAARLKLAKALRSRYACSINQICRVCGLVYDEAKSLI